MFIVGENQRERKTHGKCVKEHYAKLTRIYRLCVDTTQYSTIAIYTLDKLWSNFILWELLHSLSNLRVSIMSI